MPHNPTIPKVENGILYRHDGDVICRVGPRTGWHDWLRRPTTKSFQYRGASGQHCTVVKEPRKGKTGHTHYYFIAYRKIAGKARRVSVGKPEKVTLAALEKAAGKLAQLALKAEASGPKRGAQPPTETQELPRSQTWAQSRF